MLTRRTILKQELVKKLYPNSSSTPSAMQQLRKEINQTHELKVNIELAGNTKCHYYNKQQLELILKHFCIAPEEFELF